MKDRLIELLNVAVGDSNLTDCEIKIVADYLLENGVIVPLYKENQTVYVIDYGLGLWWEGKIVSLYFAKEYGFIYGIRFKDESFGTYTEKYVTASKEEAEQALTCQKSRQVEEGGVQE